MSKKRSSPVRNQDSTTSEISYHVPVLLQESIDALNINESGTYVDCTFGGGGHSKEILKRLGSKGRLFAFDQDSDAVSQSEADPRLMFLPHNFRHLKRFLRLEGVEKVNGILADLGVSSHQFDSGDRGFSTRFEGDLDMRMDRRQSLTAFEIVNTYAEKDLHQLFEKFGEVTNARTLAKKIVEVRDSLKLKSISNFKLAVDPVIKGNPHKYLAQVFQALRIAVNDELGALTDMLDQCDKILNKGGRIAIITFHSLEDRIVKHYFKKGSAKTEEDSNPFARQYTEYESVFKILTKKPITPSENELKQNPRSRSAKLRVAEKI